MRIAFISYEHPLGIAGGGIGTYLGQIAKLMAGRGNEVEVFTCHQQLNNTIEHEGYIVRRVHASSIAEFRQRVVDVFAEQHLAFPFDILEAAEYGAEALGVKEQFPGLSLVVKLHTPSYLTHQLNGKEVSLSQKARFHIGGLLKGKLNKAYWIYRKEEDVEYRQICLADAICSPSTSLSELVKEHWPITKPIAVIPNPFVPSADFLNLPPASAKGEELSVSFFGRLELRKGILQLMAAIPLVLQQNRKVSFRFIGKPHPSPIDGMDMEDYLKKNLVKWLDHLHFFGYQPYDKMPELLAQTQVCVFPSLWENFPNVCLEAMAAGRAVIASDNGGMAEMIQHGENGLLVPPTDPQAIANAIVRLAEHHELITEMGEKARQRVLDAYNEKAIGDLVQSFYLSTMAKKSVITA
jgi:glycosyltransferase involved in cell wall biosynthesis